jgi:hypothetical protein
VESAVLTSFNPHPEERALARVSKDVGPRCRYIRACMVPPSEASA